MTRARSELVCVADTPYYHCISRCVRRAYLCGRDALTGRDFSHRRQWVLRRMRLLAEVFAIDLCAFAIMSNHYHLVLRVDRERAQTWSDDEVVARWGRLFCGAFVAASPLTTGVADLEQGNRRRMLASLWRERLADLSWYMRTLNENIARRANAEDDCKGRFWEGRFKSQALLDEQALLTCMVYVDLNPVRAKLAHTPEESAFTSIYQRVAAHAPRTVPRRLPRMAVRQAKCPLLPFEGGGTPSSRLPFALSDYLQLVDWGARCVRADKAGYMHSTVPPILERLKMDHAGFARHVQRDGVHFVLAIGTVEHLRALAARCGRKFLKGIGAAQALFGPHSRRLSPAVQFGY